MYAGLMIMASNQTFSGQIKHLFSQIKFGQSYYMLSMEKSLSLLKIMNVLTISSPYLKPESCRPEH